MKRIALLIIIASLLKFNFIFAQDEEPFIYNDKGRRDPFFPLVDEHGKYRLDSGLPYSADQLNLSGILWDPQGKSSALINDEIVPVGESICGFKIVDIAKDSVTLSKDGREFTIRLSKKE